MPLKQGKSKEAFSQNVRTEMSSGKPKDQSLAIAYSVMRRNKRKKMAYGDQIEAGPSPKDQKDMAGTKIQQEMRTRYSEGGMVDGYPQQGKNPEEISKEMYRYKLAQGGQVENEMLDPRHEPGKGPQTSITRDSVQDPSDDNFKMMHDESLESPYKFDNSHEVEDEPRGMLGMDAKSIVSNLRAKRDNYPRPDDRYRDPYKDDKYADGGQVTQPSPSPSKTINPDLADALKHAFGKAEGGEIEDNYSHLDSLSDHTRHLNEEEGLSDSQVNSQFMNDDSLSADNSPMPEDLSRSSNMLQADDPDDQTKKNRLNKIMSMLHAKHYGNR